MAVALQMPFETTVRHTPVVGTVALQPVVSNDSWE
jgi:hypothetical protein